MGSKMQSPELRCMDPENYKKYFRALCWSGTRQTERPFKRRYKKDRHRRTKPQNAAAVCYAPALLGNPSQFAVYATVRRSVLGRWKHVHGATDDNSDDSDEEANPIVTTKIPKITGIGLHMVFSLVAQSRGTDSQFCDLALQALLDVLQGHAPEELAHEPTEIVSHMHSMLIEVAGAGTAPLERMEMPTNLTTLGTSCLISLVVARGEAELILNAVASLIMSPKALSEQYIQIPVNLTTLQRSVQSVILGTPSRNQWFNYGVPQQSLVTSFPVDLPSALTVGPNELTVRSLVSDGCFLYVFTSRGLLKIGSGYGSSIKQHVYLYKPDFFPGERHGWLGFCKSKIYVRIGRKKTEVYEVDKDTFEIKNMIKLESGITNPAEPKSAVFSDGHQLGVIMLTNNCEYLSIRFFDIEKTPEPTDGDVVTLKNRKELNVPLLRKRNLALGRASYEDGVGRRGLDNDAPLAMQLDDNEDDPLASICAGQDFGLLATVSGRVYYTGKGASLGYKAAPHSGRWTLMKETLFNKNDVPNLRKFKVVQVAVGHEGVHAILVLDNGAALFTGIARRGEDGDASKHRRAPKPTRPKKMYKTDGHHVVYAACNYGSTALVTRSGELLMFGKDTQHCDANGVLVGIREKVTQVALGKAHAVVLTHLGQVYTLGINNKGQCGRELGYTKEKHYPASHAGEDGKDNVQICQGAHAWAMAYCRVCVFCHQCTGFAAACSLAHMPSRIPGERCGCGEGDSGCSECGACRRCAVRRPSAPPPAPDAMDSGDYMEEEEPDNSREDAKSDRECKGEGQASGSDVERDAAIKVSCLPPARVAIPGGHKIVAVACGLHHTMLLTDHGEVLTFGSNQFGQLGAGDIAPHHKLVKVKAPKAAAIAAGSNHSAIMTREGEVYTFGNYQKGALGRVATATAPGGRAPVWYATPAPVPRIGPAHAARALWLSASGDQTFIQICQSVIKTDTLFSSTIIANSTTIIILPNQPEHSFKCITINKNDGVCNAWNGAEQVDFVMTLACLDPMYDVLWCYQPQMRVMKCYNILAFDSHKLQRCCNPDLDPSENVEFCYPSIGSMRRLEDFKNLENFELMCNNGDRPVDNIALSDMSILNQELAIPSIHGARVTRMHAAMHLLGCLDSLIYVHDNKLHIIECKREAITSPIAPLKADYLTVTRFENHGGGWGYSGHSVEAIRFMCDTDILLGGYGLFGGRGDYTAKIKLYDIGHDGGDQEGDGELIAESEEVVYECAPRDRFPVMFDSPMPIIACRWYVALACINGPSSDCGSAGQAMIINEDVGFHFKTSKKSNNGTDVNAGQIPSLLYNHAGSDHTIPPRIIDAGEPIINLTKNLSRKVTVPCFKSLITLLTWSWDSFKNTLLESNGLVPINYQKLNTMKHQKRLVYVIRACLRLVKSYVNEIYPQNSQKRLTHEYMAYLESIGEVKNLIQAMVAEETPTCAMLPRRSSKSKTNRVCYVQFALELTTSILKEAHETTTACFHAFFPTPTLKWNHLCSMLHHVRNGKVAATQIRELTSTCAAMCSSRSLRDVLHYVVPITQCHLMAEDMKRPDSKVLSNFVVKDVPASRANTVPRSAHSQKPPPIPPRANQKDSPRASTSSEKRRDHSEWNVLDVIPKFLDIVLIPIKQKMMTRQCGQPHDHGELKQNETLADYCCKLVVRVVAELTWSANNVKDMESATIKEMMTPSRFMRVNQTRSWNTGNGSPDAICFTVDRPGVVLVGVGVYSGAGSYEYSLELLHDMRQMNGAVDDTTTSNCWVSIDIVQGTFDGSECQNDLAIIKFEKHVHLKEDLRYALRFCNHGGRTSNGDCGLPSVKGPDGTTFRFASCSLSFNGTTLARGQLPCIVYCGTAARSFSTTVDTTDALVAALHTITMRVSSLVLERSVDLFRTLRNELTAEDLRRNITVLQQSPAINTLVPYVLANLEGMDDSKNIIKLLEHIHQLLPHVTAMNLLVPSVDECPSTTTGYYTWIESEHPYRQPSITNMRVLFPPNISWIVLEMDPRSITTQPEDTLTIYAVAGTPKQRCHCQTDIRVADPPFRKKVVQLSNDGEFEELDEDASSCNTCMHYNCSYVSVTPKLANIPQEWPQKALLVPGNEVIFALETASDYLSEYNKTQSEENRFGFRCLCAGYEDTPLTSQRQGLVALEMELVYAGSSCASKLLAPDLDVPPMVFSTLVDVHINPMNGSAEEELNSSEALLLSRGLELSSPLSVHQVLDGQSLLRCVSTERQFLMDFIAGAESTAGGRLACWLAPTPRVDPSKCEIKGPTYPAHPAQKVSLPILVKDQYGDVVASPSLRVEVVIQKHEESSARQSRTNYTDYRLSIPEHPFQPPVKENMFYQAISMMRIFTCYSFEELRLTSGIWGDAVAVIKERVPAERLLIKSQPDGSYLVNWTPKLSGVYIFRCTLDDLPIAQELSVEVSESVRESVSERGRVGLVVGAAGGGGALTSPAARVARFAVECSAGLRVRASPSLQAEELGRITNGSNLAFIEELTNKDGIWVRLSGESVRAYTDGSASVAWCLKHHRHLDMTLLVAVEPEATASATGPAALIEEIDPWAGYEKDDGDGDGDASPPPPHAPAPLLPPAPAEPQPEPGPSSDQNMAIDDSSFPYPIDLETDEDLNGPSPYSFAPEPSKRDRQMRNEAAGSASSSPRRSNGNEWWAPLRHRPDNGRDVEPIPESDMEPESDIDSEPEQQHDLKLYRDMQQPGSYRDARGVLAPRCQRRPRHEQPRVPLRRPHAVQSQEQGAAEVGAEHHAATDHPPDLKPKRARPPDVKPLVQRDNKPELPNPGPSDVPPHCTRTPLVQAYLEQKEREDAYLEQRVREEVEKLRDGNLEGENTVRIPMIVQPLGRAESQDDNDHCSMQMQVQVVSVEVHSRPGAGAGGRRVAAGTQTSPDSQPHTDSLYRGLPQASQDPNHRGNSTVPGPQRPLPYSYAFSAPPPLPARKAPAPPPPPPPPPPPNKHALSPAQAECLRAVFAALLWHEGIVHDAIACAAFLKFHPLLPKQGAQVLTRAAHDASTPRHQRHSVEVSNTGNYLRIQQSTLETLTRSGVEASTSRARRSEIGDYIRPEEDGSGTSSTPGVVNVLPPAMRALVALWDALYDSDQLSAATDKYKQPIEEVPLGPPKVVDELACFTSRGPPRVEWKTRFANTSSAVRCELCGGLSVPPPLASHMRHMHPGCRGGSLRGYDRAGVYKRTDPPPDPAPTHMPPSVCGQLMQDMTPAYQLWYIFCERCRDKGIKASSAKLLKTKAALNSNSIDVDLSSVIDHNVMKENAIFLLDLAPLTNAKSIGTAAAWNEGLGRNPPTPPGSVWQPAPPFQCLPALGAAPRPAADTARYHSLGRPAPLPPTPFCEPRRGLEGIGTASRVHRSVSMGQAGERDLANAILPPQLRNEEEDQQDTLSGAGSSLLAQPSAELLRLVGCGETGSVGCTVSAFEPPRVDTDSLIKSPVLSFVLTQRDLPAYRQKLDAAVRISTVRQYAFEALNWLMRSTTQPTCVHDVMWWFCAALDKYARLVPPPNDNDQNQEGEVGGACLGPGLGIGEAVRLGVATASTSAICPGGRSARGARAAFHAFLGSVSALAPSLPAGSPATLQAVRCWALHYSIHDRNFLHRSQVFNVISRILSHSEEATYDEGFMGTFNDSFHSFLHKENYLWACADVTAWCDISVSSRQGMTGCLLDGSTETFWESGEEDRNKAKWIQIAFPGGTLEDRPHIICVHIDNTRDTTNKILLMSFLYSGGSGEMYHMQDIEVDPKTAAWICYTLPSCYPGVTSPSLRVRCELRGPEPAVRVRQVRVLSAPARLPAPPDSPYQVIHALAEADTLRVFRLLTSQVFGKLLEWEYSGGEATDPPRDDAPADDCDLREHVVGILFAGHQLTCLQRQVMAHIVSAIGGEAARARDDWETAFLCAEAAERDTDLPLRPLLQHQDNYCFEMLSLLLALSGSHVGRTHLAQQTELLADLLTLLHTGSDRVQRQIIFLIRRMMMEIPPQRMLATINYGGEERRTLLDYLLCYLGKAINIQVKVKGSGGPAPSSVMMGTSVKSGPGAPWFMRGITTKKHAQLVANLIADMAEDKVSAAWGVETRTALAHYASQIAQVSDVDRHPHRCIALPTMWMTLASLCVCEQAHIELVNGAEGRGVRARDSNAEPRPLCANHDDGTTTAVIECRTCGALCAECDRFLHLNRAARAHHRQICKEEESAIRIDIHEGCGRAKLFWLLLLVDRRTLKGLAEFRGLDSGSGGEGAVEPVTCAGGQGPAAGVCRFCGARGNVGLLAIGNVCADHQCQEFGSSACSHVLGCGHACGGVRGERACLPCLVGCSRNAALRQDADDMCMICFTDPLQAAPSIQLGCGHVFHLHCCKKVIANRWIGPRITFSFAQCPICKVNMHHWTLSELLAPIKRLREEVQRKALMRFEYEGLGAPGAGAGDAPFDPAQYAMDRYAYYVCHKCEKAYFGGLARCEAESNGTWEPSELVCGACSDVASAKSCPKHGADFLEYKCRYCCSVAVFFCFGTSHFCNACHDDFQRVTNIPRHQLPQCPAGPKGEQLPGSAEECPLHVIHPPTGEEFALGCGVCRHAQICKEEESAIRIDIHEGCGRAKLFWLLLLVDRRTLKGLAEFRGLDSGSGGEGAVEPVTCAGGQGPAAGVCRFCGARGNVGLLAIGNVCADHQCQEFGSSACSHVLGCGHACGGVRGERACLPCLVGCSRNAALRQDADDMCMICFTDPLQAAPSIQEWINWPLIRGHVCTLAICVSLNASWRVPRDAFRYGGLAYGLVLTAALLVVALPVALLQLAVGQLSQQDAVGVWRAVPFFRGIGYLRIIVSFVSSAYSMIYVSISIAYFLYTATNSIPFPDCVEWILNEDILYENSMNASECLSKTFLSPVEDSPEYYIAIAFLLVILWIASPFVFYNPIKLMKRIFYMLAPSVILLGIITWCCIGKSSSLLEILTTDDWEHYMEPKIWHSGLVQALWSCQIAGGYLISAGDSVYSNTNVQWTSLIIIGTNVVSSWFWLLFWFGVGGGDKDQSVMAVLVQTYQVATEQSLGIAWSLLIFATLILSGIIALLTLMYPIYDRLRRMGGIKWRLITFASSLAGAGASLAMLTGRLQVLTLIEDFAVPALICLATVFELLAFGFIYGWRTLIEDVEFLIGSELKRMWVWGWWLSPGIITVLTAWWAADIFIGDSETFEWTDDAAAVLAATALAVTVLLLCAGLAVARQVHYDLLSKLRSSFQPSRHWGPRDPISHYYWLARHDEGIRGNLPRTRYNRRELGQLSRRPSFLTVSESVQSKDDLTVKQRSNSDDWLYTSARKRCIAQLYQYADERKRSKSLDWEVTIKMKGSDIIRISNDISLFSANEQNNNVVGYKNEVLT